VGDLSDSPSRQTVGACFTAAFVSKLATLLDASKAAVFKVMTVPHQLNGIVAKKRLPYNEEEYV
jgi:hypothetical protein